MYDIKCHPDVTNKQTGVAPCPSPATNPYNDASSTGSSTTSIKPLVVLTRTALAVQQLTGTT